MAGALRRRFKLSMASALALAFGGMMTLALAIVITGSYLNASTVARGLLATEADLVLDHVDREVRAFLGPAETALRVVAEQIERHEGPIDRLDPFVNGLRLAIPQLVGIGLVDGHNNIRLLGHIEPGEERFVKLPAAVFNPGMAGHPIGEVFWVDPLWSPVLKQTLLNARLPLPPDASGPRTLVTGVRLEVFAQLLNRLSRDIGQVVFVLHGKHDVVGLTGFDPKAYKLGPDHPLPTIAEIDDPVLRQIWSDEIGPLNLIEGRIRGSTRLVEQGGARYGLIYREIDAFTALPWRVGLKIDLLQTGDEFGRVVRSAIMATLISLVAILITMRIGKRLSRPVERLAERANAIQALDSRHLEPLPPSSIRELDQASSAFNAMTGALRWFETYLPRRLVAQLMEKGTPDDMLFEERVVTVMFTDVVGFTSLTEGMRSSDVATLLNGHFAQLEACIEAEGGTIDKFIGDSIMAFWGAPTAQPDHAARACRAALAIAQAVRQGATPLSLRIGIQTGPALVGNIGAPGRINYTVVGETVNQAQRLEQLGKEHPDDGGTTILLGAATVEALDDPAIRPHAIGGITLRGSSRSTTFWRLPS